MTTTPRQCAFEIIRQFDKLWMRQSGEARSDGEAQSRLKADSLIHGVLRGVGRHWPPEDRGLFTALVYTTLRKWVWLDHVITEQSVRSLTRIVPDARALLRLGITQLAWMDKIPEHAAIHATVELARKKRMHDDHIIGFVNGMLRGVQRKLQAGGYAIPTLKENAITHLSLTHSIPAWLVEKLIGQYGQSEASAILAYLNVEAALAIRVNTLKTTPDEYKQLLGKTGIAHETPDAAMPEVLAVPEFAGSPVNLPGYLDGLFTVQDVSSCRVAYRLDPEWGETVVDLCAAPGGKTTHLAALMNNTGRIIAVEPSADRITLLNENLKRLGVENTEIVESLAEQFSCPDKADRVLVDAPCSGLGTVRRHPEILLQIQPEDFPRYMKTQLAITSHAVSLLKPGGILVYSTCSIDQDENDTVIETLLKRHPTLKLEQKQQFPPTHLTDGFFIARLGLS